MWRVFHVKYTKNLYYFICLLCWVRVVEHYIWRQVFFPAFYTCERLMRVWEIKGLNAARDRREKAEDSVCVWCVSVCNQANRWSYDSFVERDSSIRTVKADVGVTAKRLTCVVLWCVVDSCTKRLWVFISQPAGNWKQKAKVCEGRKIQTVSNETDWLSRMIVKPICVWWIWFFGGECGNSVGLTL